MVTSTTLIAPASAVLGDSVRLQAVVAYLANPGAVPAGTVQFRDGSTVLGTGALDTTGNTSFSVSGLALGSHSLSAYYVTSDTSIPSNSDTSILVVYANSPDMSLTLSAETLQISYGSTSSPVRLQVDSKYGLSGTLKFSCTGLPVGMTCNFNPPQADITADGSTTTSFTISSTATAASSFWSRGFGMFLIPATLLLLWRIRAGRRQIQKYLLLFLLLATSIGGILGCGGGSKPQQPQSVQETGSKTVLVSVSSGTLTRTIPLVVNIQ